MIGYPSDVVYYDRKERAAGESKYPLKKMLAFAIEGITSLSTKPIRMITFMGIAAFFVSIGFLIWAVVDFFRGQYDHRLGEHDGVALVYRRTAPSLGRNRRRVCRKDLSGVEAPPALYHREPHAGSHPRT